MEPEARMITAAILLSVAQQRAKNVHWLGVASSRVLELSAAISAEARKFVASTGFDDMCELVGLQGDSLRHMDPDRALEAYKKITSDKWSQL